VTFLISDKTDLKIKNITRDKDGYNIVIQIFSLFCSI